MRTCLYANYLGKVFACSKCIHARSFTWAGSLYVQCAHAYAFPYAHRYASAYESTHIHRPKFASYTLSSTIMYTFFTSMVHFCVCVFQLDRNSDKSRTCIHVTYQRRHTCISIFPLWLWIYGLDLVFRYRKNLRKIK
jgi:hypothetical protein